MPASDAQPGGEGGFGSDFDRVAAITGPLDRDAAAFGDCPEDVAELAGDGEHQIDSAAVLVVADRRRDRELAQLDARKREAHREHELAVRAVAERQAVLGVERDRGGVGVGGRRFAAE